MAVTTTAIPGASGAYRSTFTVEATADGDTSATFAHGLDGVTRNNSMVILEPAAPAAQVSLWCVESLDATNVVLRKAVTAGSGAAGAQLRASVQRVHSLVE